MKRRYLMFAPTDANRNNGALACNTLNNTATTKMKPATMFRTNLNAVTCAGNPQAWTHDPNGVLNWSPGGLQTLTTRARNLGRGLVGMACGMLNALKGTMSCPLPTFAS